MININLCFVFYLYKRGQVTELLFLKWKYLKKSNLKSINYRSRLLVLEELSHYI